MNVEPKIAAYHAGGPQHAFDVEAPGTLVTGVAIAYAIVVLGLAAHLLFSDATPGWAAEQPVAAAPTPADSQDIVRTAATGE